MLDVRPKDVGLGLDEADAEDGVTEAVEEGQVRLVLEPPDVDVRVDGQPSSLNFREKADHAVALYVPELFNLLKIIQWGKLKKAFVDGAGVG